MARIQPSFLRFYLFRTRQYNTSFLLTSKGEIKYPPTLFFFFPFSFHKYLFRKHGSYPAIISSFLLIPNKTIQHSFLTYFQRRDKIFIDSFFLFSFFFPQISFQKAWLVSSHHFFVFTYSEQDNTTLVSYLLPKVR